jgi:hypothetical protein
MSKNFRAINIFYQKLEECSEQLMGCDEKLKSFSQHSILKKAHPASIMKQSRIASKQSRIPLASSNALSPQKKVISFKKITPTIHPHTNISNKLIKEQKYQNKIFQFCIFKSFVLYYI